MSPFSSRLLAVCLGARNYLLNLCFLWCVQAELFWEIGGTSTSRTSSQAPFRLPLLHFQIPQQPGHSLWLKAEAAWKQNLSLLEKMQLTPMVDTACCPKAPVDSAELCQAPLTCGHGQGPSVCVRVSIWRQAFIIPLSHLWGEIMRCRLIIAQERK